MFYFKISFFYQNFNFVFRYRGAQEPEAVQFDENADDFDYEQNSEEDDGSGRRWSTRRGKWIGRGEEDDLDLDTDDESEQRQNQRTREKLEKLGRKVRGRGKVFLSYCLFFLFCIFYIFLLQIKGALNSWRDVSPSASRSRSRSRSARKPFSLKPAARGRNFKKEKRDPLGGGIELSPEEEEKRAKRAARFGGS